MMVTVGRACFCFPEYRQVVRVIMDILNGISVLLAGLPRCSGGETLGRQLCEDLEVNSCPVLFQSPDQMLELTGTDLTIMVSRSNLTTAFETAGCQVL
jgi:hypothetical protein